MAVDLKHTRRLWYIPTTLSDGIVKGGGKGGIKTVHDATTCDKEYYIHYVNIDGLNAIIVKDGGQFKYYYTYTDYLGSILTVTDENGVSVTDRSYDAWGKSEILKLGIMKTPITANPNALPWLYRHEHLPEFGLINMNGVYTTHY